MTSQQFSGIRMFVVVLVSVLLRFSTTAVQGGTAYGTINNFDVVNDTGVECHGFEIEIEDIHSRDITYTYDWNHYGTPRISEDNSNPAHPRVVIRYASARNTNGTWAAYTAIPAGPIAPTDGHQFTNPNVNFGGEHFGVGYFGNPTNITYFWLIDDGNGNLIRGPQVRVATPTFNYVAPAGGAPAVIQAVIEPPPAPPILEFGPASWVKEIRTTSHNNNEVKLRHLVTDDPEDPDDKDWRNGEPDEVEVEWQLLQEEFNKQNGGANGELEAEPQEIPDGDEVVTRRYEFFEYVGPLDEETGEAMADSVGPDGIHGEGLKEINGEMVDLATVIIVGQYLGAQMSAFDATATVGLIEHVQDCELGEPYPTRRIVIPGALPFVATNWGTLPMGMQFNVISGELSGTPLESGVFSFTVEARDGTNAAIRRTFTLTVTDFGDELPPRSTIDTVAAPLNAGTTSGDGTYTNDNPATVIATAAPGFLFEGWEDNGKVVSKDATYSFTNSINRSLVAKFKPAGPRLNHTLQSGGALRFAWPTNAPGYVLQWNADLASTNWLSVTNAASVSGSNKEVIVTPTGQRGFFRLLKP